MEDVLVIGSTNVDFIIKNVKLPTVGETITNGVFLQTFGGKGANQAVAAARSGANVTFVSHLGNDSFASSILTGFVNDNINVSHIRLLKDSFTGTALVMIGEKGENYLSVAPGANFQFEVDDIIKVENEIANAGIIVIQNEIPQSCILKVIELGLRYDKKILFNFAPAISIDLKKLQGIYILVVNEVEASFLTELNVSDENSAILAGKKLLELGVQHVVITLGEKGCLLIKHDMQIMVPAFKVNAVDTTAAGDTFCGALAANLVMGFSIEDAIHRASAAAAICVSKLGAQISVPYKEEINEFLNANY